MAIEAGRVLNQRYRLIRPVGQGSQASVWVAEHLALTTHVAVKLIDQELAKKDSARERFRREATAAAQLRSAHVVQILDHGIDGDQPFIVMELLDGEDLFERLAHRNRLSLRETSKIVTQVARALSRAHAAGIVHRDLKPENVFLCPNEDDEVVKVLDFGVAKVKDAAKVTMQKTGVGTLIGTPHYMSPEQVKGIGEIDFHADLWALGVIAFQCVTGELPFDSEGVGDLLIKITIGEAPIPSRVYPGAPPNFDAWFAKACARDPLKRFQSAREMAMALAGVVGVIDGVAPRAPTVRPPAASAPGLGSIPLPRPPRAVTEQLDADDWEEVDEDEDEAPTRMKAPVPSSPPAPEPPKPPAPKAPVPRAAPAPAAKPNTVAPAKAPAPAAAAQPSRAGPPAPVAPVPTPAPPKPAAPRPITSAPPSPAAGSPPRAEPPKPLNGAASSSPPPRAEPVATVAAPADPAPTRVVASTPVTTGSPVGAPPPADQESQDIVDFDETIPAHDLRGSIALPLIVRARSGGDVPAVTPLSERPPPPAPPPSEPPKPPVASEPPRPPAEAIPAPAPSQRSLIAPVVMPPPRSTPAPPRPPAAEVAPASIPRPPPSSRNHPPSSAASARPSAAPVVTPVESPARTYLTDPPPEFDGGSKRRRMVRLMVAGLVIGAAGITWSVVRSQLDTTPVVAVPPTTATPSATPPPPPPPPPPVLSTTATNATAVEPGKVTHPSKPTPSGLTPGVRKGPLRSNRVPKQPNDGTIVVPEPDEDSVPAAP